MFTIQFHCIIELAASSVISLPVHPSLTNDDLDLVIEAVKKASDKIA